MEYKYKNDITSDIKSPIISARQTYSNPLPMKKFKRKIIAIILTIVSNAWEDALLYIFLTAQKYPFILADIEIKGKAIEMKYIVTGLTLLCSQLTDIVFARIINTILVKIPSKKAIFKHCLLICFRLQLESFACFSEIIFIVERLTPELAKVTAKAYTDITKLKAPTASVPILFETYILKDIEIALINNAVIDTIIPFIMNFLILDKTNHLQKYMQVNKK